ncbi:MAG: diacylglycerol kinase, partial [Armatimonadota bacterium]
TQRHMRAHLIIIAIVVGASLLLDLKAIELLIVFFTIALVITTELLNTAAEMAVDLFTPQYHPLARIIKDIAAGAVLVAAANAIVVGCVIFLRPGRWETRLGQIAAGTRTPGADEQFLLVASGMAVLALCVVLIKGMTQRGAVFAGGAVSGHSALAFFVATCVLFLTGSWGIAGLAFGLAVLISQSRVQGRIHSLDEAVIGGVLGTAVGTLVFTIGMAL